MKKAEKTKLLIVNAAKKIIGQYGYTAASTDNIAKEAGVSKGVLFYHFKSKAEIATKILSDALDDIHQQFLEIVSHSTNPVESLYAMAEQFAHLVYSNKETFRFVLAEIWRKDRDWSENMRSRENALIEIIENELCKGQVQGFLRQDANMQFAAVSIIGTTLSTAQYYLINESASEDEFIAYLCDFVAHALALKQEEA